MPLFNIPGWTVPAPPVSESTDRLSKKRKRPSDDTGRIQSAQVNLDKVVKYLRVDGQSNKAKETIVKKALDRKRQKKLQAVEEKKKTISLPIQLQPVERSSASTLTTSSRPAKKPKTEHSLADSPSAPPVEREHSDDAPVAGLTVLQKGMKQSLDGARFR